MLTEGVLLTELKFEYKDALLPSWAKKTPLFIFRLVTFFGNLGKISSTAWQHQIDPRYPQKFELPSEEKGIKVKK